MVDSRDINDLQPVVQRAARELIKRAAEKGYKIGISATLRDNEYQDYLYEIGRTRPGKIVTNAKGGESFHNYGLAFDIYNDVKNDLYNMDVIQAVGKIGRDMGLEWGGDWTSLKDYPHFQFSDGLSLKDLQNGKRVPKDAKMKWEMS